VPAWHMCLCCRLYRGDWSHGHIHGCGTAIWKQPQGEVSAAEGKFFSNEFVGDVMPCSEQEGYESAVEADMAAYQARSFLQVSGAWILSGVTCDCTNNISSLAGSTDTAPRQASFTTATAEPANAPAVLPAMPHSCHVVSCQFCKSARFLQNKQQRNIVWADRLTAAVAPLCIAASGVNRSRSSCALQLGRDKPLGQQQQQQLAPAATRV
jgi:hypothetical protein